MGAKKVTMNFHEKKKERKGNPRDGIFYKVSLAAVEKWTLVTQDIRRILEGRS